MKSSPAPGQAEAASFRKRLLAGMMLVILASTGVALYIAHRHLDKEVRERDRVEFQSRLDFLLASQQAHREAAAQRCRELAASVRIRAALEEGDVVDLYLNAKVELRDMLAAADSAATAPDGASVQADFFCFLDRLGHLLPDPERAVPPAPWEASLVLPADRLRQQSNGYLVVPGPRAAGSLREVIATPILATESGEAIGSIVLGFQPFQAAWQSGTTGIQNGLWLRGRLHMPSLDPVELAAMERQVAPLMERGTDSQSSEVIYLSGQPHLLFHRLLNPGSSFPPAWQLCVYPLGEVLARESALRWKVLLAGALIAAGSLAASHFLAQRMAAPVRRLAHDSVTHRARSEQAEAALEISEEKYRLIFENAVEGIFLLCPDGRYLEANPALARIYGYESPAALCAEFRDPAPPIVEGEEEHREMEARRSDGARIWISRHARAIRGVEGRVLHFEGTVEDITERKQAADGMLALNAELEVALANLRASQQQVIEQERLRALGEMASGIAHDFNNTLVPILGFCELLLLNPAILEQRKKAVSYLETIQTAAKDAAGVVARLREFYRSDKGDHPFSSVDLPRLVKQVVTLTQPKWKDQAQTKGATVKIALQLDPVPAIAGDESALREALTNLVFNAVDAMPEGGKLSLRTWSRGDTATVEIADSGLGMTEEVRRHCLEPFFSTKGENGTGLGLSMVFGIVKRHSGRIDLESEPGAGTTFKLSFPCRAAIGDPAEAPVRRDSLRPLRVLVVDDDALVRDTLSSVLVADTHHVTLAQDGADGLRQFVAGTFDLVITDKAMPNLSGDQMAKAIKRVSPKTPVILLTGFGLFHDKAEFPGVDVLASKPVRIPALREAIASAMDGGTPV